MTVSHINMSPNLGDSKKALLVQLLHQKANASRIFHPLSQGQRALWFMNQLAPQSAAYNEPFAWRIRSTVDIGLLRQAFQGLMDRHPVLRTTFILRNGQPVQQIHRRMAVPFVHMDWSAEELEDRLVAEAYRPFDLERDAMMRVTLVSRSAADHVLLLVFHHIAMDLWSLMILLEDLRAIYSAAKADMPAQLAGLGRPYAEFVRRQSEMLKGPEGVRLAGYWEGQLTGPLPELSLPTDRPRPAVQTYAGGSHTFTLSPELSDRLRALARSEDATLYMTMLAAFQVLLHRYTGQEDILVGSPTAGRLRPEWRRTVGYLVNPVVLRGDLSGNPSFGDFLARVKQTVTGALQHQEFPFPLLVERLQPARDPGRSPLFQVNFAWEKPMSTNPAGAGRRGFEGAGEDVDRFELADLVLERMPLKQRATKFDLTLMVLETGRSLTAAFHYNTDLWDGRSIARMAGHYCILLEEIVADRDRPVGSLPLLTAEEKSLLAHWNDTRRPCPLACLQHLIEAQVDKTPEAPAVVQGDTFLNYGELNRRANQLAHYLQKLGVGPEVKVGLCTDRSIDTVVAILAILKAGGAYVPLDPAYPRERLAFMLADAQVSVLLCKTAGQAMLPEHAARIVCLDAEQVQIAGESAENPASEVTVDNLAYIIYTSGSTGRPKGVLVTHRGLGNLAQAQIREFAVKRDSRVLQFASLSFDASVSEIAMTLCAGATLVLGTVESLLPGPGLVRLLREQRITTITLPPSVLASLPEMDFPELRTVAAAGEACSAEIVNRWAAGRRFLNAYGPTENTVCASMMVYQSGQLPGVGKRPAIGRPMDNVQIHILDANRQPVPVGVAGELYLGGLGLARGYHNRPDLTADRFVPDPFSSEAGARLYRTGDVGRWLADGTIDYLGRDDQQVKIRGFRIELGEIEAVLAQHPRVRETVVVAREDQPGEKRLVAYLVQAHGSSENPVSVSELRIFLKDQLPEYMVPAAFVRLEAMPLTANGKVDRRALPAPDSSRPELAQVYVAARTPLQSLLADIWAQVLGIERVGIHDNFFELGGASIQTLQVAEQANAHGLPLAPEMLFQYQTIAELEAACVCSSLPEQGAA